MTTQLSTPRLLASHLYMGVFITLFYVLASPTFVRLGIPSLAVLLSAEILILAPIVTGHLLWTRRQSNLTFQQLIPYQQRLSGWAYMGWSLVAIGAIALVYLPFYPVGQHLRETTFAWLPEWYFSPIVGTDDLQLVARVFLVGAFIDGLVGPIAEELFFRGYLLPRMSHLKGWAPVLNGALFGIYHFWQPHNIPVIIVIGIILSFVVWKTKNVYLGIIVHCLLNIVGALSGYFAALNGGL